MTKRPLDSFEICRLQSFAAATQTEVPAGYIAVDTSPGALLVCPMNGEAFVADFVVRELKVFEHAAGSGTDAIRQRIRARHHYEQLVMRDRFTAAA